MAQLATSSEYLGHRLLVVVLIHRKIILPRLKRGAAARIISRRERVRLHRRSPNVNRAARGGVAVPPAAAASAMLRGRKVSTAENSRGACSSPPSRSLVVRSVLRGLAEGSRRARCPRGRCLGSQPHRGGVEVHGSYTSKPPSSGHDVRRAALPAVAAARARDRRGDGVRAGRAAEGVRVERPARAGAGVRPTGGITTVSSRIRGRRKRPPPRARALARLAAAAASGSTHVFRRWQTVPSTLGHRLRRGRLLRHGVERGSPRRGRVRGADPSLRGFARAPRRPRYRRQTAGEQGHDIPPRLLRAEGHRRIRSARLLGRGPSQPRGHGGFGCRRRRRGGASPAPCARSEPPRFTRRRRCPHPEVARRTSLPIWARARPLAVAWTASPRSRSRPPRPPGPSGRRRRVDAANTAPRHCSMSTSMSTSIAASWRWRPRAVPARAVRPSPDRSPLPTVARDAPRSSPPLPRRPPRRVGRTRRTSSLGGPPPPDALIDSQSSPEGAGGVAGVESPTQRVLVAPGLGGRLGRDGGGFAAASCSAARSSSCTPRGRRGQRRARRPDRARFCFIFCPAHDDAPCAFSFRISWYLGRLRQGAGAVTAGAGSSSSQAPQPTAARVGRGSRGGGGGGGTSQSATTSRRPPDVPPTPPPTRPHRSPRVRRPAPTAVLRPSRPAVAAALLVLLLEDGAVAGLLELRCHDASCDAGTARLVPRRSGAARASSRRDRTPRAPARTRLESRGTRRTPRRTGRGAGRYRSPRGT